MERVLTVKNTPQVPRVVEPKVGAATHFVEVHALGKRKANKMARGMKKREKPLDFFDAMGKFPGLSVPEDEQDKVIYGL